ncbi:MAG: recombinase family protein [Solirubrobacteraceae bacterium]
MLIGYARVSTVDQDLALQLDALKAVGCRRCFSDTASGSLKERPQLAAALRELRDGEDPKRSGAWIASVAHCVT